MSATLSNVERCVFGSTNREPPALEDAVARPYPVVSIREPGDDEWRDERLQQVQGGLAGRMRRVSWSLVSEPEALEAAIRAGREGARVCVLRNLVRDARWVSSVFREGAAKPLLWRPAGHRHTPAYHSRYAMPDRRALDKAVLARFGGDDDDTDRTSAGGVILCATQVVEQSLDVDFDLLVTDLCPVDVLLQRIGRLHRHPDRDSRRPAGCMPPTVLVIGPGSGLEELAAGRPRGGPHGWGTVYPDLGDLEITRRLVVGRSSISLPEENRDLIEAVYHPDRRDALRAESDAWTRAIDETDGRSAGQRVHAREACLAFDRTYSENAGRWPQVGVERRIRTRLGDDRVTVQLPGPVRCWYDQGAFVDTVDLPAWVLGDAAGAEEPSVSEWVDDAEFTAFRVEGRDVRHDPHGWHWSADRSG